jgi:hypothetical protein
MGAKKKKKRGGKREGAGRPVGEDGPATIVTASIPHTLVVDLGAYCEQEGVSKSKAITEAIRGFLKRRK